MIRPGYADESLRVLAPDGIDILPIVLPGLRNVAVVEGRFPPGEYPPHFHYSLEQVTYVLAGEVVVHTWDAEAGAVVDVRVGPGGAIATLPTQTLAFTNPGPEVARVLFITAPPYPADNSDTRIVEQHRPPTAADLERAAARHRLLLEETRATVAARLSQLASACASPPSPDDTGRDEMTSE